MTIREVGVRLLAVDTATRTQSVALLEGEHVLARSDRDAGGAQARWLVPTIDRLLTSTGLTLSNLEGLAVSVGPGSFTGLRVGLATMLGFRAVTGLPLAAVPTLEAMAWNLRGSTRPLCPILKGRVGEAYWAFYRWTEGGVLEPLSRERVGSVRELAESLVEPTLMLGDGWLTYQDEIRGYLGANAEDACAAPQDGMAASAVSVGRAGLQLLACGRNAPVGLSPRYIQRSEAELKREERGRGGRRVGREFGS